MTNQYGHCMSFVPDPSPIFISIMYTMGVDSDNLMNNMYCASFNIMHHNNVNITYKQAHGDKNTLQIDVTTYQSDIHRIYVRCDDPDMIKKCQAVHELSFMPTSDVLPKLRNLGFIQIAKGGLYYSLEQM